VRTFDTERIPVDGSSSSFASTSDLRAASSRISTSAADLRKRRPTDTFGRDDHDLTWERPDKADALREAAGVPAGARA